jgi:hypothetical protein
MPFANMAFEIAGETGIPIPLAQTKTNEALGEIYDFQQWSFQLRESGWLSPGLLFQSGSQSAGTITVAAYSTSIVGDATAAAAWLAYFNAGTLPLLTSFQIRTPYYSLYNIVAYDGVNTFTIDRPWMEPSGSGQAYMVYQAYFPAPVIDFKKFIEIRDTTNSAPLDYWTKSRVDLSIEDPQRTVFNQPAFVCPYEVDNRAGSATLGYMLFELWPHPLSVLPYTMSYERRGNLLVLPSDTIPPPLTEDMVKWKTKETVYLWKESQKGDGVARGSGADWKFLAEAANVKYEKLRKPIAARDRDLVELYFRRFVRDAAIGYYGEPFANINGGLNVGRF